MLNAKPNREPVRAVCYSPDGHKLLSCSDDMAIRVWHPISGKALKVTLPPYHYPAN
jgi:WD40 repeat protein